MLYTVARGMITVERSMESTVARCIKHCSTGYGKGRCAGYGIARGAGYGIGREERLIHRGAGYGCGVSVSRKIEQNEAICNLRNESKRL